MIGICHHQAARQYANASIEDAHIYVELEASYILAGEEHFCISDDRRVGGAKKLFHIQQVRPFRVFANRLNGARHEP